MDKAFHLEFDINSKGLKDEYVSNSTSEDFELETKSSLGDIDSVTKTNRNLSQAIDFAKQILKYKKSARISLAKFLSKLYNVTVKTEDLK